MPPARALSVKMAAVQDSEKLGPVRVSSPSSDVNVLKVGSLAFVGEQGGNGAVPTFQEATGAPVEQESPLGYKVQWMTIIFLNIGQMIGTGVFSTREPLQNALPLAQAT